MELEEHLLGVLCRREEEKVEVEVGYVSESFGVPSKD